MLKNKIKITVMILSMFTTISMSELCVYANPSVEVVESKIQQYDNEITNSMAKIEKLNSQIKDNEKAMEETKINIKKTKDEYNKACDIYKQRVRNMYVYGGSEMTPITYLEVIFSSKNFNDLINKIDVIQKIINFDKKNQENILNKQTELNSKEAKFEGEIIKLKKNKENVKNEMKNIETAKLEVQSQLVALRSAETKKEKLSRGGFLSITPPMSTEANGRAKDIISEAEKYLGIPYLWGGTNPDGFDCSGLMQYVYEKYGINLPRVASDQQQTGIQIPINQIKPGDMVFFGYPAHHVGMYIGNGQFLHAPHTGDVVKIAPLNIAKVSSATRVIN